MSSFLTLSLIPNALYYELTEKSSVCDTLSPIFCSTLEGDYDPIPWDLEKTRHWETLFDHNKRQESKWYKETALIIILPI